MLKSAGKNEEWFTYGSFYAAPAHYMIGGAVWQQWYGKTRDLLLKEVRSPEGSSRDTSLKFWSGLDGNAASIGSVYPTAVYTTILALPYHYIPLYQR